MDLIALLLEAGLITEEQAESLGSVFGENVDMGEVDGEALQDAADLLHACSDQILDREDEDFTDADLARMTGIADALGAIGEEQGVREDAAAERREQMAQLAERIRPAAETDEVEDSDADEPADEPEVEPVAETDTDDGDTDDDDGDGGEPVAETDTADDTADEPEPVMAAGRVAAPRPDRYRPVPRRNETAEDIAAGITDADVAAWGLVASAQAGIRPGRVDNLADLRDVFIEAWAASEGFQGPAQKVRLFEAGPGSRGIEGFYGQNRYLGTDAVENMGRIGNAQAARQAQVRQALVASGGNPAPEENRYDIPVVGDESRPVRDQFMLRFGANRGGVRVIEPPRLADLDDATGVHTNTNDIDAASKNRATVTAGTESTQLVDAITKRLKFGEFADRFLPELIAAWVKLAAVNHARLAEETLVSLIAAAGTNVSAGDDILSATRDILAQASRLAMAVRSRERLGRDFVFDLLLPDWTHDLMVTDLSRQTPGDGLETLAVTEARLDALFQARRIRPVYSPDMQVFGEQGAGPIQGFPDNVVGHMCAPGAHVFLDGGSLNLGIVRDSTLNDTNDIEMFAETFEQHIEHHQVPSYQITMDVDPSGTTSAAAAFDPSATGS